MEGLRHPMRCKACPFLGQSSTGCVPMSCRWFGTSLMSERRRSWTGEVEEHRQQALGHGVCHTHVMERQPSPPPKQNQKACPQYLLRKRQSKAVPLRPDASSPHAASFILALQRLQASGGCVTVTTWYHNGGNGVGPPPLGMHKKGGVTPPTPLPWAGPATAAGRGVGGPRGMAARERGCIGRRDL